MSEPSDFGRFESTLLRKLYFAPFEKKTISVKAGSLSDISKSLGDFCSVQHRFTFLHKMIDHCVLQLVGDKQYVIDKEAIIRLLLQNKDFRYDYAIIEDNADLLLDSLPKIDPKML